MNVNFVNRKKDNINIRQTIASSPDTYNVLSLEGRALSMIICYAKTHPLSVASVGALLVKPYSKKMISLCLGNICFIFIMKYDCDSFLLEKTLS